MSKHTGHQYGFSAIITRALEGRISPLNFLLILGFFSSLVLLYVSLHVYFISISKDISNDRERLRTEMDENARLTAQYNELVSPERIIPIVREFGMRSGAADEVKRLALYEEKNGTADEVLEWAQAVRDDDTPYFNEIEPESR